MHEIAAIILAAGEASRFRAVAGAQGPVTKLVAHYQGKALVRHVAEAGAHAGLSPLILVTGYGDAAVRAELAGLDLVPVHNRDFASGMASSLKAGLAHVPATARGVVILLGDMPLVTPQIIAFLVQAFDANPQAGAIVPVHEGMRGNPVLLAARLFPDLMQLEGDAGARQVLRGREADVIEVAVGDPAARIDIDTPDMLRALSSDSAPQT